MKTIIIGGVAAGMTAAAKLKRLVPSQQIHVYEKGNDLSYSGCGMPYYLGDIVQDEAKLIARYASDFQQQGIDVFLSHEVTAVDPVTKQVTVKNLLTKESFQDSYDDLIIGTGTVANRTNVPGSETARVYVLNQLSDMRLIKQDIKKDRHVAIIGGGYIGVEVAENLAHLGMVVHLFQSGKQLLSVFDEAIADKAKVALEAMGVIVHLNEQLTEYQTNGPKTMVVTNQGTVDVDLVIESIGVRPNTAFLRPLGLTMLDNGAIVTNAHGETSIPHLYAAGDCAAYYHQIKQEFVYVPLGTHANKTGRIVAEHIAGLPTAFPGIVGSNILKVATLAFAKTGLGIDEALRLGLDFDYVDVTAKHQTSYYPGATDLFMRIVFEKQTGILKGAQLVGENGVSDRINIMALAITKEMTAAEFAQLDFAYAPPFSPVWDPLLVAANQIKA